MKIVVPLLLAFALVVPSLKAQDALPPAATNAAEAALKAAQDSETLQKIADKALEAAGDKGAAVADKVKSATAPKKSATTKTSGSTAANASDKADPSKWNKDETHKLAVVEIEFGGKRDSIIFELLENVAPRHVANFIDNCANKAYNDTAIHRTIDNYLVQMGDPLTADQSKRNEWGTGGEEKSVSAELKAPHKLGSVAMARRSDRVNPERSSNGFQFYFALGNMSGLDGNYSVFGQVVSGLEILQTISRTPADSNDCPIARIEVKSVKIVDQKGPLVVMRETGGTRRFTKPASAKSGWERVLERIW